MSAPESPALPVGGPFHRALQGDPLVELGPVDRGPVVECWCTDFHLEYGLHLVYCPRHGRTPDPELVTP